MAGEAVFDAGSPVFIHSTSTCSLLGPLALSFISVPAQEGLWDLWQTGKRCTLNASWEKQNSPPCDSGQG